MLRYGHMIPAYKVDFIITGILLLALITHVALNTGESMLIGVSLIGIAPVLWGALQALRKREWASMDTLASFALLFSIINGEWLSAVFIELMLAAARILSDITRDRTEKSIRGLLKFRPVTAILERNGSLISTPIEQINVGDTVIVELGQRVPVDGIILSGNAAVDESSLTGESLPVDKTTGDHVMSSTLVQSGNIRMQTTHVGRDTTLERIIKLVESARAEKPASQTLGERFGKIYLLSIFIGSGLLFAITQNTLLVLSVVLVVCADDVAIAIPIAYLRAIRSAAKHGVIVKGAKHLEALGLIDTIIFDKTGTLTTGTLAISSLKTASGTSEQELLRIGALAACRSSHPLSKALLLHAKEHGIPEKFPDSIDERSGKGMIVFEGANRIVFGKKILLTELGIQVPAELEVLAQEQANDGQSVSYLSSQDRVIGYIAAADKVKDNARAVITELRTLGIRNVIMLTGDHERIARSISTSLGIDTFYADLLPQDKVDLIKEFQSKGQVAMVGDGVNDAAALSIAGVGIAMGGLGTEGAIESAQIVLMRDDLAAIPTTICLAHMARNISIQDFWIWGISNSIGLVLVFAGFIGPAGAAAYNFCSDFFPLANSVRVRMIKK